MHNVERYRKKTKNSAVKIGQKHRTRE